jgi:hypothetical protein
VAGQSGGTEVSAIILDIGVGNFILYLSSARSACDPAIG